MTVSERLDAYVKRGLDITLNAEGNLRVRGPAWLRSLAREAILKHKDEIVAHLQSTDAVSTDASPVSGRPGASFAAARATFVEGDPRTRTGSSILVRQNARCAATTCVALSPGCSPARRCL